MSFLGSIEEAKSNGRNATVVIDGETSTSPVRDGGGSADVGGAPIATELSGAEFSQSRSRTGIQDHEVGKVVRQYGQQKKTSYK